MGHFEAQGNSTGTGGQWKVFEVGVNHTLVAVTILTIGDGGSNYAVNDVVKLISSEDTSGTGAQAVVTETEPKGGTVYSVGDTGYFIPHGDGIGNGATYTVLSLSTTYPQTAVKSIELTNAGVNYAVGDILTLSGADRCDFCTDATIVVKSIDSTTTANYTVYSRKSVCTEMNALNNTITPSLDAGATDADCWNACQNYNGAYKYSSGSNLNYFGTIINECTCSITCDALGEELCPLAGSQYNILTTGNPPASCATSP